VQSKFEGIEEIPFQHKESVNYEICYKDWRKAEHYLIIYNTDYNFVNKLENIIDFSEFVLVNHIWARLNSLVLNILQFA